MGGGLRGGGDHRRAQGAAAGEAAGAPGPGAPRARRPDVHAALLRLLGSWHLCSREYLFRHYDSEVQGRTWLRPGEGDATVIRVHPGRAQGVALAVGGNPHWCGSDPELGARHAVAEAARNVACVGARPWALTDCLNFGDPRDPAVMGDLEATIEGLRAWPQAGSIGFPRWLAATPVEDLSGRPGAAERHDRTGQHLRFSGQSLPRGPRAAEFCRGFAASE